MRLCSVCLAGWLVACFICLVGCVFLSLFVCFGRTSWEEWRRRSSGVVFLFVYFSKFVWFICLLACLFTAFSHAHE